MKTARADRQQTLTLRGRARLEHTTHAEVRAKRASKHDRASKVLPPFEARLWRAPQGEGSGRVKPSLRLAHRAHFPDLAAAAIEAVAAVGFEARNEDARR